MSFDLVRGDLSPPMPVIITVDGTAYDTSGADTVQLRWVKPDGTVMLTNLTPVDATAGEYEMQWSGTDTDLIGPYVGEIVVTTGGQQETFPSDGTKVIWFVNPSVADMTNCNFGCSGC